MLSIQWWAGITSDQCCICTLPTHYESDATRVPRDSEMVVKVTAVMETNPFNTTTTTLINISTGQCADNAVKDNLIRVKEMGL